MKIRVLLASVLGLAALMGAPAPAEAVGNGVAVVQCTARFPHVPAETWTGGGTCGGSATVAGAGVDDFGVPFTINGGGGFMAWFDYNEPCLVANQPAIVLSFAQGWFEVTDVPAIWNGIFMRVTITGLFQWNRIGLNPAITLSQVVVWFPTGTRSSLPGIGMGTATFIPPGNFNPNTQLLCGQGGGPLDIPVVIAADVSV
jgi:hypothetical protein